jgi:hypothetical protein
VADFPLPSPQGKEARAAISIDTLQNQPL